jgi:hypothetical protein
VVTRQINVGAGYADKIRAALTSYVRLKVTEKNRFWSLSVTFTVEGPQEWVDRAMAEAKAIDEAEWLDRQV